MPEGDSLYRLAAKLAPVLEMREVLSFTARRMTAETARSLVGHRIETVTSRGKNLLIRFDDGRLLHVHLAMEGRMFVERPRSSFWRPERYEPDLRLVVPNASVMGKDLAILRLLSASQAQRVPELAGLGPDLVRVGWDETEALRRLRALPQSREIADALLIQRAIAGIGNVYKSEVLFLSNVHPRTPLSCIDDATLLGLLHRASELLRRNLGNSPRTTRPTLGGARLWVYGRQGRPCLRCETAVARFMQGAAPGRSTYFCPSCQPATAPRERTA
jgi:endonuclease-8